MVDARSTEQAAQPGPRASDAQNSADSGKLHERAQCAPLPFRLWHPQGDGPRGHEIPADAVLVAVDDMCLGILYGDIAGLRENQEFIARACNCHYALVAACSFAAARLEGGNEVDQACARHLRAVIAEAEER